VRYRDAYQVRWAFSPRHIYSGIGVVTGDALAVTYFDAAPGIAAYAIGDGTRLVGAWTFAGGDGRTYSETLTKLILEVNDPANADSDPQPQPDTQQHDTRPPLRGHVAV
jgi:hypothetical protein